MPRSTQSPEAKILGWFQTAPLAAARLVLGLAKGTVAARTERGEKLHAGRKKKAKPKPAERQAVSRPTIPAPAVKKSHHKQKPTNAGTQGAHLDDFARPIGN